MITLPQLRLTEENREIYNWVKSCLDKVYLEDITRLYKEHKIDVDNINTEIDTIQSDITTIEGDITTLQSDVSTLQGDVSTLQGDVSTLQSEVAAIGPYNICNPIVDRDLVVTSGYYMISYGYLEVEDTYVFEVGDGATVYIDDLNYYTPPSGLIEMYAGPTTSVPDGWLWCNGDAISRTTYANLYLILGTTYGSGDGSLTFNLPDFRGVFPKGAGATTRAAGVDANGSFYSGALGTYSQDKAQGHYHNISRKDNSNLCPGDTANQSSGGSFGTTSDTDGGTYRYRSEAMVSNGSNGTPRIGTTTEPQSLGINFIIKY